jgi:3-hydroxybutyryl-CoA dehydrogenase
MDVKTIAVIGAGEVGRSIAYAAAASGFRTILEDMSAPRLQQGAAWIRQSFDEEVVRGNVTVQQNDAAIARVSVARSVEDASREADLVIEAVPEELELKIEIFTLLDKFAKPGSIFASSSSSLSIAEMAAVTFRAEKCVGMHFVGSVAQKSLLEIICTTETSPETILSCRDVGRRMGKDVVVVCESLAR